MKGNGWLAPALIMLAGILALAAGTGQLGAILTPYGWMEDCPMLTANTCSAEKPVCSQPVHNLLTADRGNVDAIPAEEYDKCRVYVAWNLPAGRYGNAVGSGTFLLQNLNTKSYDGKLACAVDLTSVKITITEDGQNFEKGFAELGCNLDWTEQATFYNPIGPEPECNVDNDCDSGFICVNQACVQQIPPEEDCYTSADCPEGYVCNADNECELEPEEEPEEGFDYNMAFILIGFIAIGGGAILLKRK